MITEIKRDGLPGIFMLVLLLAIIAGGVATMVSNLLVVLCSEQNTQPVVNTGSLYR